MVRSVPHRLGLGGCIERDGDGGVYCVETVGSKN